MKRMQALQPQMKALQAKYKDDPAKIQSKTWEFYKKNKVNPLGGCLPMLLQIPVFFGFFGMLRNAIELRGAPFLWINDLSQPDTIFRGARLPIFRSTPCRCIMAGAQFWQASLTPMSPGMDPAQQKMMQLHAAADGVSVLQLFLRAGALLDREHSADGAANEADQDADPANRRGHPHQSPPPRKRKNN